MTNQQPPGFYRTAGGERPGALAEGSLGRSWPVAGPPVSAAAEEPLLKAIASLGTAGFLQNFASHCAALSHADQVTMFTVDGGHVHCVFAHRPGQDQIATALCEQYLASFASRDEVLAHRLRRRDAPLAIITVRSDDIADSAYRRHLFTNVGLAGKIALLAAGTSSGYFYLNFYYRDLLSDSYATGADCISRSGPLLFALLRKHETLGGVLSQEDSAWHRVERYVRARLPQLSKREAEICAAILCGHSLEEISRQLGISHSTVKTFRRRAYNKLSIRKQSGLFARCVGLLDA